MKKVVSNLLSNISKCRDLIEKGDVKAILWNLQLFQKVMLDVKRQVGKYIKDDNHNIDFTYNDLSELSDEIYDFMHNFQQKFLFSKLKKMAMRKAPITDVTFGELCSEISNLMKLDKILRDCYMILAYFAMVLWLWGQTDNRKDIGLMLDDTLRSFIGG